MRLFTNDEWSWQLRPILLAGEAPGSVSAAQARLGWTSWLGGRRLGGADVADVARERAALAAAA